MSDFNLPEGWIHAQLGDVVDYGKCEKADPSAIKDDTWVLELEDVEKDTSKVIQCLTFAERQSKSTKNKFKKGDVLYGKLRPYLNKVVVASNDGVCTTEIIPLNGGELVNNKFIFYWLKTGEFLSYVTAVGYGVNMPRLGTEDGKAAPFVLAPLAEQQQIAQKLDELLAQVDTLKTRLDAIPNILKRFRQSVLAAAVSGRLTEEWRGYSSGEIQKIELKDLENFWVDEYRAQKRKFKLPNIASPEFEIQDLPNSWLGTQLGYVFDVYVGATPSRSENSYWGGDVSWVSSSEVAFCRIKNTKEKITEKGLAAASTHVHPKGTVMLAMIGQGKTRGQVAILDIEACHNQNTAALRVPDKFALSEYLYFYLSKQYEETRRVGGGNNQQALNKATVQSLNFPLPPIEEQTEIVRRVEQLFTYADQIEQRVKDAQARVNHLTQSILAKAFRGELTADWRAQNPELISGDNSAAALLERIKVEREVVEKAKRKAKA